MSQPPTNDDIVKLKKRARRRLVGAVVLVLMSYIGLSWILADDPQKNRPPLGPEVNITIPDPNGKNLPPVKAQAPTLTDPTVPFTSRVVAPDGTPVGAATVTPAPSAGLTGTRAVSPTPTPIPTARPTPVPGITPTIKPTPAVSGLPVHPPTGKPGVGSTTLPGATPSALPAVTPKPTATPKPSATPKPTTVGTPQADGDQYLIQFAALSDAGKVTSLQGKLTQQGVRSHTQPIKTAQGDLTRVRAGPFASRAEAETTLARLRSAGIDGKVVPR